jgi:hypothetical protein
MYLTLGRAFLHGLKTVSIYGFPGPLILEKQRLAAHRRNSNLAGEVMHLETSVTLMSDGKAGGVARRKTDQHKTRWRRG